MARRWFDQGIPVTKRVRAAPMELHYVYDGVVSINESQFGELNQQRMAESSF